MSIDLQLVKRLFAEAHEQLELLRRSLPSTSAESLEMCSDLYVILKQLEDQIRVTDRPASFYPPAGTVFIDCVQGKEQRPFIVQDASELVSQKEAGWVAFYDTVEGMGEYPRWLEDLKGGLITVVWCPVYGSFSSNEEYLKSWGMG